MNSSSCHWWSVTTVNMTHCHTFKSSSTWHVQKVWSKIIITFCCCFFGSFFTGRKRKESESDQLQWNANLSIKFVTCKARRLKRAIRILLISYRQCFWYFAEKKQNFAGFSGANSRKYRPISRGKSQNSRKNRTISRDFRGRKVKISRKIGRFRGILAEKRSIFEGFSGANS